MSCVFQKQAPGVAGVTGVNVPPAVRSPTPGRPDTGSAHVPEQGTGDLIVEVHTSYYTLHTRHIVLEYVYQRTIKYDHLYPK